MSVEQHKEINRRIVEALNARDYDALDQWFAPDVLAHHPYGPPMQGRDEMKRFMKMARVAFPDLRLSTHEMVGEGDTLITKYVAEGTHQGDYMGVPASGKPVRFAGVQILRFANGKIVDDWEIWDQLGMMQQMGLLPAPTSPPGGPPPAA